MRLGYWFLYSSVSRLIVVPLKPLVVVLISALLLTGVAYPATLQLAADAQGSCELEDPGLGGIVTVHVLLHAFDATGVAFSAPVPPGSGLTHVSDSTPFSPVGNSQTGIAVGFGFCATSGKTHVMSMQFVRTSPGASCTIYQPVPEYYSSCEFVDKPIEGVVPVVLDAETCAQARKMSPADGATDVPLNTFLSWIPGYSCYLNSGLQVFFGTSANPPTVSLGGQNPFPVGPLLPGTTYYWNIAEPGAGSVWSFTTTEKVASKQSTWGAIKALYR